jgi:hypothetical protein
MNTDRWEYHVEHSDEPPSQAHLNELGAQGWELTAALPTAGHYIFKRVAPGLRERITLEQRDAVEAERNGNPSG